MSAEAELTKPYHRYTPRHTHCDEGVNENTVINHLTRLRRKKCNKIISSRDYTGWLEEDIV